MINTNNQINPGKSRIDFSRIRKASSGMKIPKFQNSTTRNGISYIDGSTWQGNIFSGFQSELLKMLEKAKANGNIDTVVSNINVMQERYATLRAAHPNINSVSYDKAVQDYQKDIQEKYGFVNTAGVGGANGNDKRYRRLGTGDLGGSADRADADGSWANSADGLWGGKTQDRTLLGYEGDWTDEALKTENEKLKSLGYKIELDTAGKYYKLVPLTNTEISTVTQDSTVQDPDEEKSDSNAQNKPEEKENPEATTYKKSFQYKTNAFTAPFWYGANLGNTVLNAVKNYNIALQKKVPLQEASRKEYEVTNNYAAQSAYVDQAAKYRGNANRLQSSSLENNNLNSLIAEDRAANLETQAQEEKNRTFNAETQNAKDVANYNNLYATQVANENRNNLIANQNAILNTKEQMNNSIASAVGNTIGALGREWGKHKYIENQNRDYAYSQYLDNLYNQNLTELQKPWQELYEDWTKSQAFQNSFNEYYRQLEMEGTEALPMFNTEELEGLSPEEQKAKALEQFTNYVNENTDSDVYKNIYKGYEKELSDAYNIYQTKAQQALTNKSDAYARALPMLYSTQGYFNPNESLPQFIPVNKKGGKIKKEVKTENRMYKYLEHNRRIAKQMDDGVAKAAKLQQEKLKRDLDALDRETLLLLRSIFK